LFALIFKTHRHQPSPPPAAAAAAAAAAASSQELLTLPKICSPLGHLPRQNQKRLFELARLALMYVHVNGKHLTATANSTFFCITVFYFCSLFCFHASF
jgi:hypothetical protein